jgi:hypothetical protein
MKQRFKLVESQDHLRGEIMPVLASIPRSN